MPNDTVNDDAWRIMPPQPCVLKWGRELRRNIQRKCKHCGLELLTGELPGFCCGKNGSKLHVVAPLPPLPVEFNIFLNDTRVSGLSRLLNLVYSFAQMESTHEFPAQSGLPGHFAVAGRIFHRVRPDHANSAVRWLLHDGFAPASAPFQHTSWFLDIPTAWRTAFGHALLRINPLVHYINVFRHSDDVAPIPNVSLVMKNSGANEIAAVMCFENTIHTDMRQRSVVISRKVVPNADFANELVRSQSQDQNISTINRFWEPLVYPLLFPHGTLGWGVDSTSPGHLPPAATDDAPSTLMWHCRARVLREPRFEIFGRLGAEYICDMFTRRIESDLRFIRKSIEERQSDAELMGEHDVPPSDNIYLPQSFLGSNAWASAQIADALTVAAASGKATFFITVTCNPDWPEIRERLRPGQTWTDLPVVVARVFKQKFTALLQTLRTMFPAAGKQVYEIYSIEFQKRGLPHGHILVKYEQDCITPEQIDCVVSAELPTETRDRELVERLMLHRHPTRRNTDGTVTTTIPGYCSRHARTTADSVADNANFECRFHFPKPLQQTTTIGFDGRPHYRRRHPGDEWVVPYNIHLLRAFNCHINVEAANSSHMFQYLFKYIHKGVDKARVRLLRDGEEPVVDEIKDYWNARYLSAGEAAWRTLGFNLTRKTPSVSQLPVHVPDSIKHTQFKRTRKATSSLSLLDRYFHRPDGSFTSDGKTVSFDNVSYGEFYSLFRHTTFNDDNIGRESMFSERDIPAGQVRMLVVKRKESKRHYTRVESVRPSAGDRFYLRALLLARPARSFQELRTVDGAEFDTFQGAARALGLFADNCEGEYAIQEAITSYKTPNQLRHLFVDILVHDPGQLHYPTMLWERFRDDMSRDYFLWNSGDVALAYSLALEHIGRVLEEHGKTLAFFGLPDPDVRAGEVRFEIQRWAPYSQALARAAEESRLCFTQEQDAIYKDVIHAVQHNIPLRLFIDGKAGRGKTFLIQAICNYVRSVQQIILPTATSAFAALLYPGGRTTHSTFKVPVDESCELLRSPIEKSDSRAQLLQQARVVVWDEVPMANRAVLACVDDVCKRVTDVDEPFGGKVMLLAGDFRQTCPVVRRGTAAQVIDASIRKSPLWPAFDIRHLTIPLRQAEDVEFADWVDAIGDGAAPDVDLSFLQHVVTEDELIHFTFPPDVLADPKACLKRAILCPTNAQIDKYNDTIIGRVQGEIRTYYAADSVKEALDADAVEEDGATLDYAARTALPGIPSHAINIKTNAVYRLMRNISIARGLVKNVRVLIREVGTRIITVSLLRDRDGQVVLDPEDILITRITFEFFLPETRRTLVRRQFPLAPAYATTFNSCQGLTLDVVGMDLMRPVFSHGQLYTALSRVRRRENIRVRLRPGQNTTVNVVYRDILL